MYKQIIPATDWFFVEYHEDQDALGIYYVAAWGLSEEMGNVYGLISVLGSQQFDTNNNCARLVQVPPHGRGMYKHKEELNNLERQALKNNGFLKNLSKYQEKELV